MGYVAGAETDEHGNFKYTLRQYLLMRQLETRGADEWTAICGDVTKQVLDNEWDPDALATYDEHQAWFRGEPHTESGGAK